MCNVLDGNRYISDNSFIAPRVFLGKVHTSDHGVDFENENMQVKDVKTGGEFNLCLENTRPPVRTDRATLREMRDHANTERTDARDQCLARAIDIKNRYHETRRKQRQMQIHMTRRAFRVGNSDTTREACNERTRGTG